MSAGSVEQGKVDELMREFCLESVKKGVAAICEEFIQTKAETQAPKTTRAFDAHPTKNRLYVAPCLDSSRVKLSFPPGCDDYIHASWVNGDNSPKKFICAQAPKPETVEDFWRMVWQEGCGRIVMLCNTVEFGRDRCAKYWPDKGQERRLSCGLTVRCFHVEMFADSIRSSLLEVVHENGEHHQLEHLHWTNWPDRSAPPLSLDVFRLLDRPTPLSPTVVHCSAGVGRTGTLVSLDITYRRIMRGVKVSLDEVVREVRASRHRAVDADVQYGYLHRVVMELAVARALVTREEIRSFSRDYDALLERHNSILDESGQK